MHEEAWRGGDVLLAQRRRDNAVERGGVGAEEQLRGVDSEGEERVGLAAEVVVHVETGGRGGGEGDGEEEGAWVWQVRERRRKVEFDRQKVAGELTGGAGEKRGRIRTLARR